LVLYLWNPRDADLDSPARRCFAEFEQIHPTLSARLRPEHAANQRKGYRAAGDEGLLFWRRPPGSTANHTVEETADAGKPRKRPAAIKLRQTEAGIVMLCRREPTLGGCIASRVFQEGSFRMRRRP
jgi:hypothetical protein